MDIYEELNQIIEISKGVLERKIEPFKVDVKELLARLNRIFDKLRDIEEYLKDAEAMHGIANILKEQTYELNFRSEILYLPPEIMIEKIKKLDLLSLANLLVLSMNPIMYTSHLTNESLLNAYEYWQSMKRISMEKKEEVQNIININFEELGLRERKSLEKLENLKEELNRIAPISLREILKNKNFDEKIEMLYLLSYLITDGIFYLKEKEDELIVTKEKNQFKGTIVIEASKWAKE